MVRLGVMCAKNAWKKRVWERAWELDRCYWGVEAKWHRSLDLLSKLSDRPKYSIWWLISDRNHEMMRDCEVMIKLISHASLLKDDDVRLKGLSIANRFCARCDLAAMDDVRHLVMQCPSLQHLRNTMFRELALVNDGAGCDLMEDGTDMILLLLGKEPENHPPSEQQMKFWSVAARHIACMYRAKLWMGIG